MSVRYIHVACRKYALTDLFHIGIHVHNCAAKLILRHQSHLKFRAKIYFRVQWVAYPIANIAGVTRETKRVENKRATDAKRLLWSNFFASCRAYTRDCCYQYACIQQ